MTITREAAEEFTEGLGTVFSGSWKLILSAKNMGVPEALDMTLEEWVKQRLGGYVQLTLEERQKAAKELTAPKEEGGEGLTNVEAAKVLGVSDQTISRDRRGGSTNVEPNGVQASRKDKGDSTNVEPDGQKRPTFGDVEKEVVEKVGEDIARREPTEILRAVMRQAPLLQRYRPEELLNDMDPKERRQTAKEVRQLIEILQAFLEVANGRPNRLEVVS